MITLQNYKDYYGLVKTDEDTRTQLVIDASNSLIKAYLGTGLTDYYSVPKVETISIDYDTDVIFPQIYPIVAVSSITESSIDSGGSTVYLTLTTDVDYIVLEDRILRIYNSAPYCWAQGPASIVLTYTAGYSATPGDVKLASILLTHYYLQEEYKQSKTIMGTSIINVVSKDPSIPPYIRALLDPYKAT